MAFEMPLDQINQLQILLRRDANVTWYEPEKEDGRVPLPRLPSVAETVAKLDPSPPYLRCQSCNGRLLRGIQSSICVFCGANPHKDLPPEPIKFKNTLGYKWLLESLQLDGSEMVAPIVEQNATSRGRNESKDEIPLSELLDLEIRWPSEAERAQSSSSETVAFQGKSSLGLDGADLNSFFNRREADSDAFEQNLASRSQVGDTASGNSFQANENLSLFRNVQSSEGAAESTEDQGDDSFSGWEANFKSASSGPVNEESKSLYHSNVDLDTESESRKDSAGVNMNDDIHPLASTESDWFPVDGWRTSNSEAPSQTGKPESNTDLNDTKPVESADGSFTRNFDSMQDDQWHGPDNKTIAVVSTDEVDDSFDAWNDFSASASTQDPSNIISSLKTTEQTGKSEITADLDNTKTAEGSSSSINDFDWIQNDQWPGSNNKTTISNEVADSFDDWNDFTGSANAQYSSSNLSNSVVMGQTEKFEFTKDHSDTKVAESGSGSSTNFDWMQDDQWPGTGSNNKPTGIVTTNEVSDSFDYWNDFTGFSVAQNPSSSVPNFDINGLTGKSETSTDFHQSKTEVAANTPVQSFDWMQDDQWKVSNNKSNDTITTREVADSFDVWNSFTSKATTQDPPNNVWKPTVNQTSSEQTSESNLLSSLNSSHDVDFSEFSQHDLFLGQFSSPPSSAATNAQSAAAYTNRVADVDATRGTSSDVSTAQVGSKGDEVEMLMSQLHDLSFMLDSHLSIPPK